MKIKNIEPRKYQEEIFKTAKKNNTLVVLPTGIGKTAIALMLSVERLSKFPDSKILILSPTKPLCAQHVKSFIKLSNLNEKDVILYTGYTTPLQRKKLWETGKIIIATPQTIKSDIENKRIGLENVSLLVVDEAHRSRMKYANTFVAGNYKKESKNERILALTASPGSTKERINEVCENLGINAVEIRSTEDEDVKPYVQEKKINWISLKLPKEFETIQKLIKEIKKEKEESLRKTVNKKSFNKKDLLDLQRSFRKSITRGNQRAYWGISLTAQLLKLSYALELIETQGIRQLNEYWDKLDEENTRAARSITSDSRIRKAMQLSLDFKEKNHPKMEKIKDLVSSELSKNKDSRIIIFANFRNTVKEIENELKKQKGINPIVLVGQKEGISQKEQISRIKNFSEGLYNVLIGTSISEEGLDITSANLAIFYEPVPSEIRMIQRSGRVGRVIKGEIIILITQKTRDEAYYWSSRSKEKTMKKTLYNLKENFPTQKRLKEF